MKQLEDKACAKAGITGKPLACRALGSLISDLIYTPIITTAMVTMAYLKMQGGKPPYLIMWGKSMLSSLLVAYLLVFLVSENYMKLILKHNGVGGTPNGKGPRS